MPGTQSLRSTDIATRARRIDGRCFALTLTFSPELGSTGSLAEVKALIQHALSSPAELPFHSSNLLQSGQQARFDSGELAGYVFQKDHISHSLDLRFSSSGAVEHCLLKRLRPRRDAPTEILASWDNATKFGHETVPFSIEKKLPDYTVPQTFVQQLVLPIGQSVTNDLREAFNALAEDYIDQDQLDNAGSMCVIFNGKENTLQHNGASYHSHVAWAEDFTYDFALKFNRSNQLEKLHVIRQSRADSGAEEILFMQGMPLHPEGYDAGTSGLTQNTLPQIPADVMDRACGWVRQEIIDWMRDSNAVPPPAAALVFRSLQESPNAWKTSAWHLAAAAEENVTIDILAQNMALNHLAYQKDAEIIDYLAPCTDPVTRRKVFGRDTVENFYLYLSRHHGLALDLLAVAEREAMIEAFAQQETDLKTATTEMLQTYVAIRNVS